MAKARCLYIIAGALFVLVVALLTLPYLPRTWVGAKEYDPVYRLQKHSMVAVIFDACPVSDEGWNGQDDFLGSIICGKEYWVWYDPAILLWHAQGPNEETLFLNPNAPVHHSATPGGPPDQWRLHIWGLSLIFAPDGRVMIDGGPVVGHLQLAPVQREMLGLSVGTS